MKKTNTIIMFLMAAMLISCAERTNIVTADKALTDLNLSVNLGTRTATDPNAVTAEEAIYSARLIVVGTVKGNANYQKVTCNKYFSAADISADQIIRARTRTGVSDIYLIVNEEARETTDVSAPTKPLDHIATLGDLEKATLVFPASPVVGGRHIPMMRCFRGVDILPDLTTHVGGDFEGGRVERMWAKVRVRFQSRDEDLAAGKLDLTGSVINSVELHSIPKHILLDQGQRYTDDLTAVDRLITKDYTLAKTIASDVQGYLFYLPEHILTSADRMSYLLVKGTIKGKQRTYRIYLGNNDKPKGDFNITRNQFYDYTGTVCSMGDGEIEIVMDVQPWNVVNSNGVVGEYLKLSTTTVEMLEMDEEVTITYTGPAPTSITFAHAALEDRIETTITNDGVNSGKITFKRKDMVHDGKKYSSLIAIQCSPTVPPTYMLVSIEQYSVNIGGTLKTSADGLRRYWSGGVNWATGNLVVKDYVNNVGMHISGDPRDQGLKFKYEIDWGLRFLPYDGVVHELTNGGGPTDPIFQSARPYTDIATFLVPNICGNAGRYAGVVDNTTGNDNANYWRVPTTADGRALAALTATDSEKPDPLDPHIRVFKKRLLINGLGYFQSNGRLFLNGPGGFWLKNGATGSNQNPDFNFMQINGGNLENTDYYNAHSYRCVRNNTYSPK